MPGAKSVSKERLFKHVDREAYDLKGSVDYHKLKSALHVTVSFLAQAVGRTARTLERNATTETIQKKLRKIVFVRTLLKSMTGSPEEAKIWLEAPNPEFGGKSPLDIIKEGGVDAVIGYLLDVRKGSLM